ncbi:MAG TPA: universal stress protein [Gemmatimonadaceae bacterium]|nr:universal stress protein [Gemmatimonadaceae bacterium]
MSDRALDVPIKLLLAITNDSLAPAATAVALALERERSARPSVVYVIEIGPSVPEAAMLVAQLEEPQGLAREAVGMRPVLHIDQGAAASWPFEIAVGSVAREVVEAAQREEVDLIVMGLSRHSTVGRAIGNDTVREVMTIGGVPVLAVRTELTGLPKRVVIAVDFSRASIRAAQLVRRLIDDNCSVHLLFVESDSPRETTESAEGLQLIRSRGVDDAFAELIQTLDAPPGMTIDANVRQGRPVAEITRFCEEIAPDLVAVGSQHHRFLDRLLLGSVGKAIAGDGRWSVLVTPPGIVEHTPPLEVSAARR